MDRDHRTASALSISRRSRGLQAVLVLAAASLPFLSGLSAPFFFDDLHTVVYNRAIADFDLLRFFTDPTAFSAKFGNWPYRPLVLAVNSLLLKTCGLSPPAWHLFQLLLHAVNSWLVLVSAQRVFGLKRGALFAALLFALAPLQTQAALYLSARSMVLALGPALIAVMAAVQAAQPETGRPHAWMFLAWAAAFMSVFSSEGAIALLFWLPLVFYVNRVRWREKNGWQTMLGVAVIIALYFFARLKFSPGPALAAHPGIKPPYTPLQHFVLQLYTPFLMARLFFVPVHLSLLHYAPAEAPLSAGRFLLPGLGLLITFFLLFAARKKPALFGGGMWYLAALLPSVFVPLNIPWAEHRCYLALPGLCMAAADLLERIWWCMEKTRGRVLRPAALSFVILFSSLALFTWHRSRQWSSPVALFRDAARKAPRYDVPWNFLAFFAHEQSRYAEAVRYLNLTLARNPRFADAYNTRADSFLKLGRPAAAQKDAETAVRLDPENPTYWNTLAVVFITQEKWEDAEQAMRQALERLPPDDPNRPVIEGNYRKLLAEQQVRAKRP